MESPPLNKDRRISGGRDTALAMSQENVEIVRAAYDAYNRGDVDAALKYAAPDFELDWSRAVGPQRGIYRLDQVRSFFGDFLEASSRPASRRTTSSRRMSTW